MTTMAHLPDHRPLSVRRSAASLSFSSRRSTPPTARLPLVCLPHCSTWQTWSKLCRSFSASSTPATAATRAIACSASSFARGARQRAWATSGTPSSRWLQSVVNCFLGPFQRVTLSAQHSSPPSSRRPRRCSRRLACVVSPSVCSCPQRSPFLLPLPSLMLIVLDSSLFHLPQ